MKHGTAMPARDRGALALAAMIAFAAPAAYADAPSQSRQAELIYRLRQDCGSCHGYTLKGGLGPSLLPAALRGKDDDTLVHVILYGMPGRPMPPWKFEVTRDEAFWLVRRMKKGLKHER
ncbi:MAG: cytochrome c [Alphaproteobacteria bacterium]|nr:cytochrome c [Alphaproteobacteria bacterium]